MAKKKQAKRASKKPSKPKKKKTRASKKPAVAPQKEAASKETEKSSSMHWLVGIAVVVILVMVFFPKGDLSGPALEGELAQEGDTIEVLFRGLLTDGTVFDTNIEEAAHAANIYNPDTPYGPTKVVVGSNTLMAQVSDALVGMRINEKKKITIPAGEAFGPYSEENIVWFPRVVENERTVRIGRYLDVSRSDVDAYFGERESLEGLVIPSPETGVNYTFIREEEGQVIFEITVALGQYIQVPDTVWPSKVYLRDGGTIYARQEVEEGKVYETPTGIVSILEATPEKFTTQLQVQLGDRVSTPRFEGNVVAINETHMQIDANHYLAQEEIIYELMRVG